MPVFQNEKNLLQTLNSLLELELHLPNMEIEFIFIDDGSSDGSYKLLLNLLEKTNVKFKLVKLTRNFGQSPALQAGLSQASGHCVGIISADLQEPHLKFIDMIEEWNLGAMFIIGERISRNEGVLHKLLSSIYWGILRNYAFRDFPKMGYDFCVIDRKLVDEINLMNEKNTSIFALIYWLGYKPVKIQISRSNRKVGDSQWSLIKKINFTIGTLVGFTYIPLRIITFTAVFASIISISYLLYLLQFWIRGNEIPPGWMTVVGFLVVFGSLTLFSLAIICEYLLKILDESRKRPSYIIESINNN